MKISTQNLQQMPAPAKARSMMQSAAMLDAILSPDWESRYFSFNAHWDTSTVMASVRNGAGDDFFATFSEAGAIIKGFDHESVMSPYAQDKEQVWPGVLDIVPSEFKSFLTEPAFTLQDTTFCIWCLNNETAWRCGNVVWPEIGDDGSLGLLWIFENPVKQYQDWAETYYEKPVSFEIVQHIFDHKILTSTIVKTLNPDIDLQDLQADIKEIAYPEKN